MTEGVNDSFGKKVADKIAPETGIINLQSVTSPALLYFKRVYQIEKAAADKKAEYTNKPQNNGVVCKLLLKALGRPAVSKRREPNSS